MKKLLLIAAATMLALAGCTEDDGPHGPVVTPAKQHSRPVNFTFSAEEPIRVTSTRTMDENAVGEIHLFLFGYRNYHFVVPEGETRFTARIDNYGDYTVYALTNCPDIHAGMTAAELEALLVDFDPDAERMPMSYRSTVTIGENSTVVPISLKRSLAKVSFNISVATDLADEISIESVWLKNVPQAVAVFDTQSITSGVGFSDKEWDEGLAADGFSGSVLLPENKQGTKFGPYHTPANATYLLIRGSSENRITEYRVYLGLDNSANYNFRRGTHYVYNVTINGTDKSNGMRLDYYSISLGEPEQPNVTPKMSVGERPMQKFEVRSHPVGEPYHKVRVTAECLAGDIEHLTIAGRPASEGVVEVGTYDLPWMDYDLFDGNKTISYDPPLITPDNTDVVIKYTFTDQYGYETEFVVTHPYYNAIVLYFTWPGQGSGTVGSWGYSNYVEDYHLKNGTIDFTEVYCIDDYVEIDVQGLPIFRGFYSDPQCTRLITMEQKTRIYPTQACLHVYPLFLPEEE